MDEAREDRYIELKVKYPELTRADLHAIFPELEQFEQSPRVRQKLASIKLRELEEAAAQNVLTELAEMKRRAKLKSQKDRALEVIDEALYSKDINIRLRAAFKSLGRDYARDTKLGELEAQKEIAKENPDEPYPEPPGATESVE